MQIDFQIILNMIVMEKILFLDPHIKPILIDMMYDLKNALFSKNIEVPFGCEEVYV